MRIMPYRHRPTNAATSMDILAAVLLIPPTPTVDACTKRELYKGLQMCTVLNLIETPFLNANTSIK